MFTLEQFWRLTDGEMNLQDGQLAIDASFAAATYFDGNELWGTATASYSGSIASGFEPIEPVGGLQEQRDSCVLDGCWQGAFVGNVVTGPALVKHCWIHIPLARLDLILRGMVPSCR